MRVVVSDFAMVVSIEEIPEAVISEDVRCFADASGGGFFNCGKKGCRGWCRDGGYAEENRLLEGQELVDGPEVGYQDVSCGLPDEVKKQILGELAVAESQGNTELGVVVRADGRC